MPPRKRKASDPSYNPRSQKRGSRRATSARQSVSGSSVHAAATSTSVPAETETDPIQEAIDTLGTTEGNVSSDVDAARARLQGYTEGKEGDITDKVLYQMLDMLPDAEGKSALAHDINSKQSDEDLRMLVSDLKWSLFTPLKAQGGKTPTPSQTPSSSSSSSSSSSGQPLSEKRKVRSSTVQAALKRACLARDRYRCVMTGTLDPAGASELPAEDRSKPTWSSTQCAHIIPYSIAPQGKEGTLETLELRRVSKIWAFIFRYFPSVKSVLDPRVSGQVNLPRNAMTILSGLHPDFGRFELALEHIESTRYKIRTFWKFESIYANNLPVSRIIDLRPANETEAPSQVLLTAHCAIAKIIHASGMAEEIDAQVDRDQYEPTTLAEDGSTNLEEVVGKWFLRAY
ncbi:hypothetical protein NFIA_089580 [Paecilomyces variotii No. 5]|uniref:Uncharacterized protein n=1 Tax=Byssochlamys spectabilis (strain No. 5 / NBRC 109023) TaxID=1356009 RepID=V5FZ69_BYSSN|nr:hypothetical protein NFIA_089580 [Paecilomyces variotii No. 5]